MEKDSIRVKVIISEDLQSQSNGPSQVNLVVNPVLVLRSQFVPSSVSFGVTVIVKDLPAKQENRFEILVKNEQNDETVYTTGINDFNFPNASDNFLVNLNLRNIAFRNEGAYAVVVKMNNEEIKKEVFYFRANESLLR